MSLHDIMVIKLKQDLLTKCKEYNTTIDEDVLHSLQCSNKRKVGSDYCGCHSNEMKRKGHLRFDDIRKPKPDFDLTKLESGWREPLKQLWRPSAEEELQNLLHQQSRKVILTTPKLILD